MIVEISFEVSIMKAFGSVKTGVTIKVIIPECSFSESRLISFKEEVARSSRV